VTSFLITFVIDTTLNSTTEVWRCLLYSNHANKRTAIRFRAVSKLLPE